MNHYGLQLTRKYQVLMAHYSSPALSDMVVWWLVQVALSRRKGVEGASLSARTLSPRNFSLVRRLPIAPAVAAESLQW